MAALLYADFFLWVPEVSAMPTVATNKVANIIRYLIKSTKLDKKHDTGYMALIFSVKKAQVQHFTTNCATS